jgi:hypothetical protein
VVCGFAIGILFGTVNLLADPIPIGEIILNGEFGTDLAPSLKNWKVHGVANARPSTDLINTGLGNTGFNNFFTSAFASIGDNKEELGSSPNTGDSHIQQTFTLAAVVDGKTVTSYPLTIRFRTVFDGYDNQENDIFSATLNNFDLLTQTSWALPTGELSALGPDQQLTTDHNQVLTVLPGTYRLRFALEEQIGSDTQTAAGIDSVSITAIASVPEPSLLLLLGSGISLLGLTTIFRRA